MRLCRFKNHPMATLAQSEGRIKNIIWLEIDDCVIRWRTTKFSNINATANNAIITSTPSTALESDDLQAEILIENALSVRWIIFP